MAVPLAMMSDDAPAEQQPAPQHPPPCCPLTLLHPCQYSAGFVRAYLMDRVAARMAGVPWADYLADRLRGDADEVSLLVQNNRGRGGIIEKARNIVLSLEMASAKHGIPLTISNHRRLSALLCRFAECGR